MGDVEATTSRTSGNLASNDAVSPSNVTIINNFTWDPTESPGRVGTIMSFVTIIIGIVVSIITYRYAPNYINTSDFNNLCENNEYQDSCKANSAVMRMSLAMTVIFAIQAIGTKLFTKFYDTFWVIKFCAFIGLVIWFFNIENDIFDTDGYAWFARITGFFFLILQQVILIDLAYTWNEKWIKYSLVEESDSVSLLEGNCWLCGIIFFSLVFYVLSFGAIGVMFWQFNNDCSDTMVILSLTIVLSVVATFIQLFVSDTGSLLTSSIMTAYATYVAYSAITLNPSGTCNPTLNTRYQTLSTIIGLTLTAISLVWTTYSAVSTIPQVTDANTGNTIDLGSIATGGRESGGSKSAAATDNPTPYHSRLLNTLFVQISLVFLCVSGYYAMILTNWSTEQSDTSISNPRIGEAAMWIQAAGQWIAIVLYIWSLVAPKILTDREF